MSQNINLYDPALRKRRDLLGFEASLGVVGAAILAVALGAAAARWSLGAVEPLAASGSAQLETQQAAVRALAATAMTSKPDSTTQSAIALAQRQLQSRRAALQALAGNAPDQEGGFSTRLQALARQSVDGLWLTGMVLHRNDLLLKGRALAPASIPAYVQRLDNEPSLEGHSFRALDVSRPLDGTARGAAPSPAASAAPAAAQRAEFVEFTLVGSDATDPPASDKAVRP